MNTTLLLLLLVTTCLFGCKEEDKPKIKTTIQENLKCINGTVYEKGQSGSYWLIFDKNGKALEC